MEEITLSGGTLMGAGEANLGGSSGGNGGGSNGGHHHSHSHSHAGVTCDGNHDDNHNDNHNDNHGNMEMMDHSSLEELVNSSKEDIARALSTLFRFGRYEALTPLLEQLSQQKGTEALCDIIQVPDDGGHTLLHWAAKRVDDMRFLQSLVDLIVQLKRTDLLNTASVDNVGMRPLHWACTEGSIPHLAVLLKHGADMEAKDTSGCTPLLIASQYGQVQVVAYLLKQGANGQAVDASWDTALHWAAYKGSIQVCGLLSFYQKLDWSTQDAYGQTPMHLAALRGHTSVVRYILAQLPKKKDILFVKDKNERTPLDLAIHKNRPTVETVLREAMAEVEDPRGHFFRKTIWSTLKECKSSKSWKNWLGLNPLSDEMDEPMRMPYYFVLFNFGLHFLFMITLFAPFTNAEKGILWDKSGWLLWNFVVTFCSWYTFYKTVKTKPGYLDDSHANIAKWRKMYEETLDAYADESQEGKLAAETVRYVTTK
jgi:ankyrin repeat protein